MKNFLNLLVLSPLLIYVVLLLSNTNILTKKLELNLFWIGGTFDAPVITFISLFFVTYTLVLYSLSKFSNFFVVNKNKNLTWEVNELKAKMHDREPKLLESLEKKFSEILEKSQTENKKNIDILKKENEKVVTSLNYDLKIIKEKIEKIKTDK